MLLATAPTTGSALFQVVDYPLMGFLISPLNQCFSSGWQITICYLPQKITLLAHFGGPFCACRKACGNRWRGVVEPLIVDERMVRRNIS